MARPKPPIKWRQQDKTKVSRYVQKFNAGITRLEKLNPELIDTGTLPERLDVSEILTQITTRADFNRFIKRVDRFFKPRAKDIIMSPSGYRMTRWGVKEAKLTERRINRQRAAFVEQMKISKPEQKALKLKPIDIFKEHQRLLNSNSPSKLQKWLNFLYTMEHESGDNYYTNMSVKVQESYIKALKNTFGDQSETLVNFIKDNEIKGTDILYAISKNDILDFEYLYSRDDADAKLEMLTEYWLQIYNEIKQERKVNDTDSGLRN